MAITYSIGNLAVGNATTAVTVPLPPDVAVADILVCCSYGRATGGASMSSTYTTITAGAGSNIKLLFSYRVATGSDPAPVVTPVGMSGAQKTMHRCISIRGLSLATPFGNFSAFSQNATAEDIGPITAPTSPPPAGGILCFGSRLELWTSVAPLSGDTFSWSQLFADNDNTVGNPLAAVANIGTWTGGAPTLSAKTFDVTGGTNGVGGGLMILLIAAAEAVSITPSGGMNLLVGGNVPSLARLYAPGVGSIGLTGPSLGLSSILAVPAEASLLLTGGQPAVTISTLNTLTPAAPAALNLTGPQPSLTRIIKPAGMVLGLAGGIPRLSRTFNLDGCNIVFIGNAPSLLGGGQGEGVIALYRAMYKSMTAAIPSSMVSTD